MLRCSRCPPVWESAVLARSSIWNAFFKGEIAEMDRVLSHENSEENTGQSQKKL